MMSEQEFAKGLTFLKSYYVNWNFDITNTMTLSIWYESFKEIEYQSFQEIVKSYCKSNRFPPQSPFDILDMIPKNIDVNTAWELIRDIAKRCDYKNSMFRNMVYKENKEIYEIVKNYDLENLEEDTFGNKCLGFIYEKAFRKIYKEYLDSIKIKYINNTLITFNNNSNMIENKGENLSYD